MRRDLEINNEIIRMRHFVRQARVCVINKLVREAKTLRTKNGSDKQKEKNTRKADKLISEIYALKKIKDDRITKFAITNTKTLKEILESKNVSESTRIISRVADHKSLRSAVEQFRETYPDYKEYLQPKKPKKPVKKPAQKAEGRSGVQTRSVASTSSVSGSTIQDESHLSADSGSSSEEGNVNEPDLEAGNILRINTASCAQTKQNKHSKKNKSSTLSSEGDTVKSNENDDNSKHMRVTKETEASIKSGNQQPIKIVSKEATVKRFTELLQEENIGEGIEEQDELLTKQGSKSQKKVDEFFMSGDGNIYLSTAAAIEHESENMSADEDMTVTNREFPTKTSFKNNKFSNHSRHHDIRHERLRNEKYERKIPNYSNKNRDKVPFNKVEKHKTFSKGRYNDVRSTNDMENLHPSWAARKKQQEIMKIGFQGKKIVFDDV